MNYNFKLSSTNFEDHFQIQDINEVFYEKFRTNEDA